MRERIGASAGKPPDIFDIWKQGTMSRRKTGHEVEKDLVADFVKAQRGEAKATYPTRVRAEPVPFRVKKS